MESPPLWVWALIVGIIIAGKLIYRWEITKELARGSRRSGSLNPTNWNWSLNGKRRMGDHKYNPQNYSPSRFKDYLAMRKRKAKNSEHL